MKVFIACISVFVFVCFGCDENQGVENLPEERNFIFQEDFESSTNINELFHADGSRWSNIQVVNPSNGENEIGLSVGPIGSREKTLKIFSFPSDDILSKIDIEKSGLVLSEGGELLIQFDVYINSTEELSDLFLFDLECCQCWDPTVVDNQCPGIRLKLGGGKNYLSIERGKILGSTLVQSELPLPLQEWVKVQWNMKLSSEDTGDNVLMINGIEVINVRGKNMPNASEFKEAFSKEEIDFTLQSPLNYERIQIGATANPTAHPVELYIDNVLLQYQL